MSPETATISSTTSTAAPPPPDATAADAARGELPAYCDMPATRLAAGKTPGRFSPKGGQLGSFHVSVDLDGDGAKEYITNYGCTAGGVSWPELLLVYRSGGVLGGVVKLSDFAQKEHSDVSAMTARGSSVALAWTAYEGAGFFNRYFTGTLTMAAGKPKVAVVPGRIEFSSQSGGGALTKQSDVSDLEGTSAGFRAIVAKDLAAALKEGADCGGGQAEVSVDNYWPDYVANGSVHGCGGALVIWYVTKGAWKGYYYQSVPMCSELKAAGLPSPLPKRIGMVCMTTGGKTVAY